MILISNRGSQSLQFGRGPLPFGGEILHLTVRLIEFPLHFSCLGSIRIR